MRTGILLHMLAWHEDTNAAAAFLVHRAWNTGGPFPHIAALIDGLLCSHSPSPMLVHSIFSLPVL